MRANGPGGSCPLRRRQRTGGEDDLIGRQSADATVEVDLESGDRRTLDEESTGVGGGDDREILVAEAGLEVGPPGVQSLPVADIELDPADSLDAARIVVGVEGDPGLHGRGEHVLLQPVASEVGAHIHRTGRAAGVGDLPVKVLDRLKHR